VTDLSNQKRMASEILGVGKNKIWIDPHRLEDVSMAIRKDDIRDLIEEGAIKAPQGKGASRGRTREREKEIKKGRHRGHGKRKGSKNSRKSKKEKWMDRIRAQRKRLREMKKDGEISKRTYRKLYNKSKGGEIRDVKTLEIVAQKMEEELNE